MANWTLLPVVALLACVWALVALTWSATGPGTSWTAVLVGVVATSVVARSALAVFRGPRLQGTWWGELDSNYVDPASGTRLGPIAVAVVVRQSWTDLFVCLHSKESSSITIAAGRVTEADGRVCLVGVYRNEPKLPRQDTSRMHHGGLKLSVIDGERPRMQGTYWTDRGTAGEIELAFLSRRRAHDFREASGLAEQLGVPARVSTGGTRALGEAADRRRGGVRLYDHAGPTRDDSRAAGRSSWSDCKLVRGDAEGPLGVAATRGEGRERKAR